MSDFLTTGSAAVDELLGGGIERGVVTQLYGAPASGKTNLVLTAAAEVAAAGGSVLYIDSEDLSMVRFRDIAEARTDVPVQEVAGRLVVSEAMSFTEQGEAVKDAAELADVVDLIVLDSATGFYRRERTEDSRGGESVREVARHVTQLLSLARKHDLGVLITNQVFTDPDADRDRPLGGNTLEHWTGVILRLERFRGGNRRATLEKHRSRAAGDTARFRITGSGVEAVEETV